MKGTRFPPGWLLPTVGIVHFLYFIQLKRCVLAHGRSDTTTFLTTVPLILLQRPHDTTQRRFRCILGFGILRCRFSSVQWTRLYKLHRRPRYRGALLALLPRAPSPLATHPLLHRFIAYAHTAPTTFPPRRPRSSPTLLPLKCLTRMTGRGLVLLLIGSIFPFCGKERRWQRSGTACCRPFPWTVSRERSGAVPHP